MAFTTDFRGIDGVMLKRIFVVQRFSVREALDARDALLRSKLVDEATITTGWTDIKDVVKK
jgi:hypothetical protein